MAVGQRAGPEDRLADPHDGGTFLDRDCVITRHAHGEVVERDAVGRITEQPVTQLPHQPEAGANARRIGGKNRKRHQPADFQRGEGGKFAQEGGRVLGREAVFGGLTRAVDLHEGVERAAFDLQAPVERFGHLQAVERLGLGGEAGDIFRLVGLQMADHRPGDGKIGHRLGLFARLLHLVLSEFGEPRRMRHADAGLLHRLGDRQQTHLGRAAPGARAGGDDACPHRGEIARDVLGAARCGEVAMADRRPAHRLRPRARRARPKAPPAPCARVPGRMSGPRCAGAGRRSAPRRVRPHGR